MEIWDQDPKGDTRGYLRLSEENSYEFPCLEKDPAEH